MNKRNLYILYAMALLQGMVFYAPVATLYRQAAGLGIFEISVIESISLALTVALEIPWGYLADRIGYRKTMVICCVLYFVSKLIFWQAAGFGGFLLERILLAAVCAGLSGVDSSMLFLSCGEADSHRAFSIYQNLGEAGMLAAAAVYALWLGENYRRAACWTVVTYGIAALLALGLQEVKTEAETRQGSPARALLGQLRNKKLLFLVLAAALLGETHQSITVFLNQLKYDSLNISSKIIAAAFIAVSLMGLTGGFSARLREKIGAEKMGRILLLLAFGCCLILAGTENAAAAVGAVLLLRGCFSLFGPLYQDLQNRAITTADRATVLSMNAVIHDGLGIFLNLVFGAVAQHHLNGAFVFGAALCLLGYGLYRKSWQ
ncbi:MAG: MFS transporter [Oscillospiraceae bacterium]|nr:MFS transporter [Oscillospiraceae bacterium]